MGERSARCLSTLRKTEALRHWGGEGPSMPALVLDSEPFDRCPVPTQVDDICLRLQVFSEPIPWSVLHLSLFSLLCIMSLARLFTLGIHSELVPQNCLHAYAELLKRG